MWVFFFFLVVEEKENVDCFLEAEAEGSRWLVRALVL
jgi:hypothetical protein